MDYTNEQYAMMERLKSGVTWDTLNSGERETLRYLLADGIAQAREDIQPGYFELSQVGRRRIESHNVHIRQEQQEKEDARRIAEDEKAAKAAERATDHRFQNKLATKQTVLTALLGALFSNLDRIENLAKLIFELVRGLIKH